jgi:hypothetical protein
MTDNKTTLELAREIARYLGPGWTVETITYDALTHHDRAYLNHRDGWQLYMVNGGSHSYRTRDPRRLDISGRYRRQDWYNMTRDQAPAITVAKERGPAAIAREIARRLIPRYETFYGNLEAAYAHYDQTRADEMAAMDLIAETVHGRTNNRAERGSGNLEVRFGNYGSFNWPYGKAHRFYHGRLHLELDYLTAQETVTLLETLIRLRAN